MAAEDPAPVVPAAAPAAAPAPVPVAKTPMEADARNHPPAAVGRVTPTKPKPHRPHGQVTALMRPQPRRLWRRPMPGAADGLPASARPVVNLRIRAREMAGFGESGSCAPRWWVLSHSWSPR